MLQQNKERIAVISAEAGIFDMVKGRYSGQVNREVYLKGHSGDYLRVDRRGRTEIVDSPGITIGIFGQPDTIKNLPSVFHDRGLTARFLYSLPKDFKGFRKTRPTPVQADIRNKYNLYIKAMMSKVGEKSVMLSFDTDADILFEDFQQKVEIQLRDAGTLSNIPEWGGKIVGNIARIAGLLHIANYAESLDENPIPEKINAETVYKAISISSYFIQHAMAAFGKMRIDGEQEDASYLLKIIVRKYQRTYEETGRCNLPLSFREVQQIAKSRFDSKRLKVLIQELEERGFVRAFLDAKNFGKSKQYLLINPFLLINPPHHPNMESIIAAAPV